MYMIQVMAGTLSILIGAFCGIFQPQPDEIWHFVLWIGHNHLHLTINTYHICTFFVKQKSLPLVQFQEIAHTSGMFIAGFALLFQKLWRLQGHSSEIKWILAMSVASTARGANTWTSCQQKVSICNSEIKTESMLSLNRCMFIVIRY